MKIIETVGIDVSKLTIDVVIHSNGRHRQFKNNEEGFKDMIKWVNIHHIGLQVSQCLMQQM